MLDHHQGLAFRDLADQRDGVGRSTEVRERTERILQEIGMWDRRDAIAGVLTMTKWVALEVELKIASGTNVVILDEPTAGMSRHETDRAVELIRHISEGRPLMIVEHDMSVVFGLADRISVLVYGEIIASGPPNEIRNSAKVKEAYLGEEAHA